MPGWERIGFLTDCHHPFQDERAISLTLQILEEWRPGLVFVGSDGCEFAALSRFADSIRYHGMTRDDVRAFRAGIRDLKSAVPKARLCYIAGNHDRRYEDYLLNVPELLQEEAFYLWNWLGLEDLKVGYQFTSDAAGGLFMSSRWQLTPNLLFLHGDYVRKYSGWSAKAQLLEGERMMTSLVMGHCHRGGKFETADRYGKPIGGYEAYHHQRTDLRWLQGRNPDWQWGTVLVETQMKEPWQFSVIQLNYLPTPNGKLRARWREKEWISK